jgi:hypothetical protein
MLPFGTNLTLATCFYDKDLVNLGDEEGVYLFNSYQTREWTDDRIQTRLSFNAGGSYNWISAPITHSYECGLPEVRILFFAPFIIKLRRSLTNCACVGSDLPITFTWPCRGGSNLLQEVPACVYHC